jgi:hypothetical protein
MIIDFSGGWSFQHIQAAKKRGFTRTGRSDNARHISRTYGKINISQYLIAAKCFSQMLDFKDFFTHDHFSSFFLG